MLESISPGASLLAKTLENQRALAPKSVILNRLEGVASEEFLEKFYAPARPVVIAGEMADWPALTWWTPDYLKAKTGAREVEFQTRRDSNPDYERTKTSIAFVRRSQSSSTGSPPPVRATMSI